MNIHENFSVPEDVLSFLRHCYKFVNVDWQHAIREPLPDQGFEKRFRESCVTKFTGWNISQERELHLGSGLDTASGVCHEVDIVAENPEVLIILELKNRQGCLPEKNDVIVFFAKIFDYLALNSALLLKDICPIFISNSQFDQTGLSACLGLGIHPIAPELRPLPLLIYNAKMMAVELDRGVIVGAIVQEEFEDFCAQLNRLSLILGETWFSYRYGYLSDKAIVLRAVGTLHTAGIGEELRKLNSECSHLLTAFRTVKAGVHL